MALGTFHRYRQFGWSLVGLAAILPFQNCSVGFKPTHMSALNSGSAPAEVSRFAAAKEVIQRNCLGCHYPGAGPANLDLPTEQAFIEAGLVVAGNLERSKLIFRLKNYPVATAARNMPPTGELTHAQYGSLTDWVLNMPGAADSQTNYFACDSNEAPSTLDAKRLSKTQLYNSLHLLISRAFGGTAASMALDNAPVSFSIRVPADTRAPYSKSDGNFDYAHAKAYFDIADALADWIADASRYELFVSTYLAYNRGACAYSAGAALTTTCRDALIRNFILRAWGRPIEETNANLNNELLSFQREFDLAASTAAGVNAMVFKAITSPQFLFHVHTDAIPEAGTIYRLSNHSLARRLSLNFMQTGLDETLLGIAQNQNLTTDAGFQAALAYVTGRMAPAVREFAWEWLKLDGMPAFVNTSHPKFQMIANGINLNSGLRSAMQEEIAEMMTYLAEQNRPATELLTTNVSFARNSDLMRIYGQSTPAPSTVTEQTAPRFPASERSGLMTRAGYLVSGGYDERLVMRGVHVREQILCLELSGMVPPNATATPLPTDNNMTLREKYHAVTSGSNCVGCHSQINPVGFAFSHYNSIGGYQTQEPVFDSAGQFVRNLPVNSTINTQAFLGENREIEGPVAFSHHVARSQDFKRCLTQHFYSYFHGLSSRTRVQRSCSMRRMYQAIDGGGTLADFMRAVAQEPQFKTRSVVK